MSLENNEEAKKISDLDYYNLGAIFEEISYNLEQRANSLRDKGRTEEADHLESACVHLSQAHIDIDTLQNILKENKNEKQEA